VWIFIAIIIHTTDHVKSTYLANALLTYRCEAQIKQELLDDNDLHQAAITYARNNGIRIQEAEDMVEEYIEEIVPFFSITSIH